MNISYNWLKDYVNFDLSPEELSAALTSIGLETGGIEEVQTIKGGLNGLVIGKVSLVRITPTQIICTLLPWIWGNPSLFKSCVELRMLRRDNTW